MTEQKTGARLKVKGKPHGEYEIDTVLKLGRSSRSDVIVKSHRASRHHAEVRALSNGKYCVWDSGSRNGTFLNGQRITGSRVLQHGDEIGVGDLTLVFLGDPTVNSVITAFTDHGTDVTDIRLEERRALTLVSDIRKYTTLSEKYGKRFQTFVAEWFRAVVGLIQRQRGIVDKIHGDGLLAYWWLPSDGTEEQTVRYALQTCDGMLNLRDAFAQRLDDLLPGEEFNIGIGVHTGDVMLGNLGTGSVQAFTAVGDAVNVTFRLEELTKAYKQPVLVSHAVKAIAPPEFTLVDLDEVQIRGLSGRVTIWSLKGYSQRPLAAPPEDESTATEEATDAMLKKDTLAGAK